MENQSPAANPQQGDGSSHSSGETPERVDPPARQNNQPEGSVSTPQRIHTMATSAVQITPPDSFDFSNSANWPKWIRRFERFRIASGLIDKPDEYQVNSLLYTLGDTADDILSVLPLSEADKKNFDKVKSAFETHFVGTHNVIYERAKFNLRMQEQGESAESFITSVHTLAENCKFGALRDELIRDRIVVGIRDKKLSERLQLDSTLTLKSAITTVRQNEMVKKQQLLLHGETSDHNVDSIRYKGKGPRPQAEKGKYPREKPSQLRTAQNSPRAGAERECKWCGGTQYHQWKDCPARDANCRKCEKRGHYAAVCRSSRAVHAVTQQRWQEDDEEYELLLGSVTVNTVSTRSVTEWMETLSLNGEPVTFKLDTGAAVTAIPQEIFKVERDGPLTKPSKVLYGPGNNVLEVQGCFKSTMSAKGNSAAQEVYVVTGLSKPLLGLPAIEALHLVQRIEEVRDTPDDYKAAYPTVFRGLGCLKESYTIALEGDAIPFALSTPRRIPIPLRGEVREELDRMEAMGVISKVTQPTDWCAGMVVIPKTNGKIRVCVDLTHLNKWVKRERHILPSVDQTLAQLSGAKVFSKLDARSGFWQIPLAEESALLTTFITPYGRYCFNRLPFGISSAPEHFQRRMSQMMESQEGVLCHADDILVFGRNKEEHDRRLHQVLQKAKEEGLTLNEKCEFGRDSMIFVGHTVTAAGIEADPGKVKAITNMPEPKNVADVRRLLGMANYLAKFIPGLATITTPLKELLCDRNEWCWGLSQVEAFKQLKLALSSPQVLAQYSPTAETRVAADASSYGIGAVLTQKQTDGTWRPITYISRSLTDTEKRYAQIEKEALAATWACERLYSYLLGLKFTLITDHKPLLPLLGSRGLDELPPRILRFRLRLLRFTYEIQHVPGKSLITADTLSRAPIKDAPSVAERQLERDVQVFVDTVRAALPASEPRLQQIAEAQRADKACSSVARYCLQGWPEKSELEPEAKPFWSERGNLHLINNLLLKDDRLVIPLSLQKETLQQLHKGHQGIGKCRARAIQAVWWPGLSRQIKDMVINCDPCRINQTPHREPMQSTPTPARPWQRLGTDLFTWKENAYLLIVDYFSRYIEVARLTATTSLSVIAALKEAFSRHGIPDTLVSDNGPQYVSEVFKDFATAYQFQHVTSSPRYPQATGEAERAVGTVKSLWKKGTDQSEALLAYRATPLEHGYSPAQLLMGRHLRTTVPQPEKSLVPRWPNLEEFKRADRQGRLKQEARFNRRHLARPLPFLSQGQEVWITTDNIPGAVLRQAETPRSVLVQTDRGVFRRNRFHLRAVGNPPETPPVPDPGPLQADTQPGPQQTDTQSVTTTRSGRVSRPPDRLDV